MKAIRVHYVWGLLMLGFFVHKAEGQTQQTDRLIDIQVREVNLDSAFTMISDISGVFFSYNAELIPQKQLFTLAELQRPLHEVLKKLLTGTGLEYKVVGDQIVILKPAVTTNEEQKEDYVLLFGTVTDEETGAPIQGVNVFIAESMLGGATDQNGFFSIERLPLGTYNLTFSHIAYELGVKKIPIEKLQDVALKVSLVSKLDQLESIEIVSTRDKRWERYLRQFQTSFLGATPNASRCVITNDHVLDFQYYENEDLLVAYASEPLVIENWALGYKIYYILELFEHSRGTTRYVGKSKFEELTPSDVGEMKRWEKNRLKSYRGSIGHFINALTENRLRKEGFQLYKVYDLPINNPVPYYEVNIASIIKDGSHAYERKLSFKDYMQVIYLRESEPVAYVEEKQKLMSNNAASTVGLNYKLVDESLTNKQISYLQLNIPTVSVDKRGFIYDPLAVTTLGYWSWERLAEQLPIEYEPPKRPSKHPNR